MSFTKGTLFFHLLCSIITCSSTLLYANEENDAMPTINIATIDKEQLFHKNGPVRGLLEQHIASNLPQYQINYIEKSFIDFWAQAQAGEPICSIFATPQISDINTIQSKRATFLTPMPAIVIHQRAIAKLNNKAINAESILMNDKLMGGYNAGRRYPASIQKLINKKTNQRESSLYGSDLSIAELHRYVANGQLDYFIGLPQIISALSGVNTDDFVILPFEDTALHPLYLVCSDIDIHRKFLQDFDRSAFNWYHHKQFREIWQILHPTDAENNYPILNHFIDRQMR